MGCTVVWFLATAGRPPFGGPPTTSITGFLAGTAVYHRSLALLVDANLTGAVLVPILGAVLWETPRPPPLPGDRLPVSHAGLLSTLSSSGKRQPCLQLSWSPFWARSFCRHPNHLHHQEGSFLPGMAVCHQFSALPMDADLACSCVGSCSGSGPSQNPRPSQLPAFWPARQTAIDSGLFWSTPNLRPPEDPRPPQWLASLSSKAVCYRSWVYLVGAILATSCLVPVLEAPSLPGRASPVGAAPGRSRTAATVRRFDHLVATQARLRHPNDHHRQASQRLLTPTVHQQRDHSLWFPTMHMRSS